MGSYQVTEQVSEIALVEKEYAYDKLSELLDEQVPTSFELNVQQGKGRPPLGWKRKGSSSTTRDPFLF